MKRNVWSPTIAVVLLVFAWAAPKGTVPHSSASQYPAHGQQDGVAVGAKLLTRAEVRKTFVSDLNQCCVVLELAIFPPSGKSVAVSLDDVSLRAAGSDISARASSASVVAAVLQKSARQQRDVTVSPTASVGYESGTVYNPTTGAGTGTYRGVYKSAGVGVGVGERGAQPGASEQDRSVMETELNEKSLPEGAASNPVAGYLYFQFSPKANHAKYQLQYTLHGNRMSLMLP
jgi:hypothetical protein